MPHSSIIPPFSIAGGLAGLARGLDGWTAIEHRATQVMGLLTEAPRQRTQPAVLLVQLLAHVTVHNRGQAPASVPSALLLALSAVLGVEKHAARAAVLAGPLPDADAAQLLRVSTRTVQRHRARHPEPSMNADTIAARAAAWKGRGNPPGVPEALYDLAATEVASGTYFSHALLWALAEVLGVAHRDTGLTQSATEVLHNGLRNPDRFIATGLAEGRLELEQAGGGEIGARRLLGAAARRGLEDEAPSSRVSTKKLAAEVGSPESVKRWRAEDSQHSTAYELNRLNAAAFARFNAPGKGRK